jgi:membrane-bound lytic murein transglycosylase A
MQGMKKWFEDYPQQADEILNHNESYIFFHESPKSATGSLGVPLVAQRNLAVDRNYIPLGLPVYIKTQNPITQEKINQLMIAADTGGAIKGKIRADFYWGFGDDAAQIAGKMKELGKLFVLLPKEVMQ